MEWTQVILLGAVLLAIAISLLAYQRSGQPFTFTGFTEALEASRPLAERIRDVAEVIVGGVQQLKETGKIDTGADAFDEAMGHLHHWFPEVEPERLIPFIEDAYRGIKIARGLIAAQQRDEF